jgi:uncharacterized protein with HEPN domain
MNAIARARLRDALAACRAIGTFLAGRSFLEYQENLLLRSAVERQFEIVGEALRRAELADSRVVERVADLRRIVGLRNRLIHGYDAVDQQIIWSVIHEDLPLLIDELTVALDDAKA